MIPGVESVILSGDTPYHYVIEFNRGRIAGLGITAQDISNAFSSAHHDEVLGMTSIDGSSYEVRLKSGLCDSDFGSIPIKVVSGRLIHLEDIAEWRMCESVPSSYFRLNGLNTITLSFDINPDENLIAVSDDIRHNMSELSCSFPDGMSATIGSDSSVYMRREIRRILVRTGLCLLLLLAFVLLASHSWRYLLIIFLTLVINILVSIALYAITGIRIHAYTLAGITVSLGIIIDTSIVMVDHWKRCHDRTVFPALIGAVVTTVASLSVILFLPDSEKASLSDFAGVIVINLAVSLLVAWFVVPALMRYIPVNERNGRHTLAHKRHAVIWRRRYSSYVTWGAKHRIFLAAIAVASFGIPTFLLPHSTDNQNAESQKWWQKLAYSVAEWKPYADHRYVIDRILGSSFGLFNRAISRADFYRKPHEKVLSINAGMPDGCNVGQLDEIVRKMENYLSQFDEIDRYITNIWSYDNASIDVYFKPEAESSWFPSELKSKVTSMAISYGGATWRISGIDERSFNNNVTAKRFSNRISLSGYNYDDLLEYADILVQDLMRNRRVSNPMIWSNDNRALPETEMHMDYDYEHISAIGASPYNYYSALRSPLYSNRIGGVLNHGTYVGVDLVSSDRNSMDAWHITNTSVPVDSLTVKLTDIGTLEKRLSGLPIRKRNQSYYLNIKYDYIGNWMRAEKMEKALVSKFNRKSFRWDIWQPDRHVDGSMIPETNMLA
jgi:Cation/multidrug efflux pump